MRKIYTLSIFLLAYLLSYTQSSTRYSATTNPSAYAFNYTSESTAKILDRYGRTLILHGLNTASNAKHSMGHQPWIAEKDVNREDSEFCFNAVRYLIFWGAIEPEKDKYDDNYLRQVKERVEWYTSRKMYVILDMHQDVYGYGVGGNGAPDWACTQTAIKNMIPDKWAWWLQNLEPKVKRSYVVFWRYKKRKELQEHYIKAWLKIVTLFKNNPYVIGYDLMNEPHGGNITKTLCGHFERKWLPAFYQRLIPAIRNVEKEKYLFFEPRSFGVNFGMKSHLKKVKDTATTDKLVYAPHCYPRFVDLSKPYNTAAKKELYRWFDRRKKEMQLHQTTALVGEFGLSPSNPAYSSYLNDFFTKIDENKMSWTYWSSDPGGWGPFNADLSPSPILANLLRIYPKATSGELLHYNYNAEKRIFTMTFITNPAISQPTEIAIPRGLYPYGYHLVVNTNEMYRTQIEPNNQTLLLYIDGEKNHVSVSIYPK